MSKRKLKYKVGDRVIIKRKDDIDTGKRGTIVKIDNDLDYIPYLVSIEGSGEYYYVAMELKRDDSYDNCVGNELLKQISLDN